jgi:hypothetical protein
MNPQADKIIQLILQYLITSSEIKAKLNWGNISYLFFFFGATAPIWALAYLHETLRFTSVLQILDSR